MAGTEPRAGTPSRPALAAGKWISPIRACTCPYPVSVPILSPYPDSQVPIPSFIPRFTQSYTQSRAHFAQSVSPVPIPSLVQSIPILTMAEPIPSLAQATHDT